MNDCLRLTHVKEWRYFHNIIVEIYSAFHQHYKEYISTSQQELIEYFS